MKNNIFFHLAICSIFLFIAAETAKAQQIWVTSPVDGQVFSSASEINITAEVSGVAYAEPAYLLVNHNLTGYRKLKLGNNPNSLYSPAINLTEGGNNQVEITLRDFGGNCNWSKIKFRPQATGDLVLAPYVNAAGGIGNEWKTITIPLADFGSAVNLTQVSLIEFPYSAGAGGFNIGFSGIRFTGGSVPYNWFGQGKTNNIHDGSRITAGGLPAQLIPESSSGNNLVKVEFYLNGTKTGEDQQAPFTVTVASLEPGEYQMFSRIVMSDSSRIDSETISFVVEPAPPSLLSIILDSPQPNSVITTDSVIIISGTVMGASPPEPDYLRVTNQLSGYRKLKLGFNPASIYSPGNNVIAGGNHTLSITLKSSGSQVNWSKIQIRPASKGTLPLAGYIPAGVNTQEWFTLQIPLSAFNNLVDFTSLAFMEFPYSADAGNFSLDISDIRFTGGSAPFVWFGDGKTNNSHDGYGGTGQLVATLIPGNNSGETIQKVEFYVNSVKTGEDFTFPYQFTWSSDEPGNFDLLGRVLTGSNLTAISDTVSITVSQSALQPSVLSIGITQPAGNQEFFSPADITIETQISGLDTVSLPYLRVWNVQTGYRKLKMGYSSSKIYGPAVDVLAGGNHTLEITLVNFGQPADWNKIRLRPAGIGSLTLNNYVNQAGGVGNTWTTISIPLADFDPTIDFSQLIYFEFPYSADAGNFDIGIASIMFTGGSSPLTWFGPGKYDNAHDGFGNPGQLMALLVLPGENPVIVSKVEFYINESLVGEMTTEPYSFQIDDLPAGNYSIRARLTDSDGKYSESDSVNITVLNAFPEGALAVTIEFDQPPSAVSVTKAALRYNKDFAYSFSLDDSYRDAYTHGYTLFNGGYVPENNTSYSGLLYTDGCGNDQKFTGAIMWNSVNSNFSDIHINTPGYMTWGHLIEMVNNGWNVVNHSYSHAYGAGTDYDFQVYKNVEYVQEKTGFVMKHFATPSGDGNYVPFAFSNGMKSVVNNNAAYNGFPNGYKVDGSPNLQQFKLYRRFLSDGLYNPSNITQFVDNVAGMSVNGNHYWYSDFTHRVGFQQISGCLIFPTLEYYMTYIANTYGKNGSDRVWVAGHQDVYEYLAVRESSEINWFLSGSQLTIIINKDSIPDDLDHYALSLLVNSDAGIISVTPSEPIQMSWNNQATKLLNLEWSAPQQKSGMIVEDQDFTTVPPSDKPVLIAPNPAHDELIIYSGNQPEWESVEIYNLHNHLMVKEYFPVFTGSYTLNLNGFPAGLYFIRIKSVNGEVMVDKFVKE